jgi:hypothetical protein
MRLKKGGWGIFYLEKRSDKYVMSISNFAYPTHSTKKSLVVKSLQNRVEF